MYGDTSVVDETDVFFVKAAMYARVDDVFESALPIGLGALLDVCL